MSNAKKVNSGAGKRDAFNYQDGAILNAPCFFLFTGAAGFNEKRG